jgi:radical SAM protein with 4Fe4S-binding SPASM domain
MCNIVKMQRPPKMMPMETYLKVLDRCAEAKIKSIRLHTYGETLLHPRLAEMIREAARRRLSVWISTNAQLLDEKRGRRLLEAGVDTVRYSVEGTTRETYERIRKGGSWETLLRNMKQFKALRDELRPRTRLSLNMILMRDTLEESERVNEVFGHLVDEIVLSPLEGLGDHGRELSAGQWLEEVDYTHRNACRLLWEMMNISVDGKVTLCCADLEAANVVGDAITEDFGSIWRGPKLESFRSLHRQGKFHQIGICSNCSFGSTNSVANRFRYSLLNEKSAKGRFQMR